MADGSGTGSLVRSLRRLLENLAAADYHFIMPTLATHGRVARRKRHAEPGDLRDIFGWTRLFKASDLPDDLLERLSEAGLVERAGEAEWRSAVRVSVLDGDLIAHSADNRRTDAVFFGPDSYRFARYLRTVVNGKDEVRRALDVGVGPGAGALTLAGLLPDSEVLGTDVNPAALAYLEANAAHAGRTVRGVPGSGLSTATGDFDLIVANPPFIAGGGGRTYRDGGGSLGADLAIKWVQEALGRLQPGGRFVLYTGSAIARGRDTVRVALESVPGMDIQYEEIDPDIFGGILDTSPYRDVERIAAVGAVLTKR